jgi:DNA topoisomerase-2
MASRKTTPTDVKKTSPKTIEELYQKKTDREHVLLRPDMYIGDITIQTENLWIYQNEKIEKKPMIYVAGLYKIYDEIIVNARDRTIVDETCDTIKVNINQQEGLIEVWNNGQGIPVVIHKEYNIYVPELIFGEFKTSTNYDDSQARITGGRNGLGSKVSNIFSSEFTVETVDTENKRKFIQTFTNNMAERTKPKIYGIKSENPKSYTKISFKPDLAKFGLKEISDDFVALFKKRVYDLAGSSRNTTKVFFNDERIEVIGFKNYIDLYYPDYTSQCIFEENERWQVGIIYVPDNCFEQISYVNGICTYYGGTHVNYVIDVVVKKLIDIIEKKYKGIKVKPNQIKDNLIVFVNAIIENPSFTSQTKEQLKTKPSDFGSTFEISEKAIKKIASFGIINQVGDLIKFKEMDSLKKTDGKKVQSVRGIPKLEDAEDAGTKNSINCKLILTEGDSAKALAMSARKVISNKYYGVFPLKGKLLNVRSATPKQLTENEEIINLIKILGLKYKSEYNDIKQLRYGGIILMTDADVDGTHIKGLLINFIHYFWPSLLKTNKFITCLATPIVKASKGTRVISFYNSTQYEQWKETHNGWNIKYYKGLGTSTAKEALEYFDDVENKLIRYQWNEKEIKNIYNPYIEDQLDEYLTSNNGCEDSLLLAFGKEKESANDRKKWLANYDRKRVNEPDNKEIDYAEFVHNEFIHFANYDNIRSIPTLMDGLKPSQKKILYACYLKKLFKDEIKVAQLSGFIAEKTCYHHGEVSLQEAIIGMAQNFVGSNNINLLLPSGQFGTRLMKNDSASPRYIFTRLSDITPYIFRQEDMPILNYLEDDGIQIEPDFFVPIIPMVLVNGVDGIGTGYSSQLPNYNPLDIVKNLYAFIEGKTIKDMIPWYRGFKGKINKLSETQYESCGIYTCKDDLTMEITELPIGTWTTPYKEYLETLETGDTKGKKIKIPVHIQKFKDNNTDDTVHFTIYFPEEHDTLYELRQANIINETFKLTEKFSTTNMHLFNSNGKIKKYISPIEIIEEFGKVRLKYYTKRKEYMISQLDQELNLLKYKMMFIEYVLNKKIIIEKQKKEIIINRLEELKFPKLSENNSYDYLLNMPLYSLTLEKIDDLKKKLEDKEEELENLKATTEREMWRLELDEFVIKYNEYLKSFEDNKPKIIKKIIKSKK